MSEIELVNGDIRNPLIVMKACENIDVVCHLAAINGTEFFYSKPHLTLEVAVKGMMNVLDACVKNRVGELLFLSSSEVYQGVEKFPTSEDQCLTVPDPLNPRYSYGGGKLISELMAINYGRQFFKRVLIVRPHNVYGPDMGEEHVIPQFLLRLKKSKFNNQSKISNFSIQGSGNETRSFIFIDDFISGLDIILKKGDHLGIYNLGTSEEISIKDLAFQLANVNEQKIKIKPGKLRQGSTQRRCPDVTKIKNLGFVPKISLARGLELTSHWYNLQ